MEELLHYVWKHKLFALKPLQTTDGQPIEIIDPGLANMHAGPDFFNAKIKISDVTWVGNIEIHQQASDWFRHNHHLDPAYDSVILHVASDIDATPTRSNGEVIPQMELHYPPYLLKNYEELIRADRYPACFRIIPQLPSFLLHSWLSTLQVERFEHKTQHIEKLLQEYNHDWENVFFITLARNFGFGVNSDAFEVWAKNIPLAAVNKHRDNLFQIEAFFFGQAGLLQELPVDAYTEDIIKEYNYLKQKFGLQPSSDCRWRLLRLRPGNFPHIRIAQLACLYHRSQGLFSQLMETESLKELRNLLKGGNFGILADTLYVWYSLSFTSQNHQPELNRFAYHQYGSTISLCLWQTQVERYFVPACHPTAGGAEAGKQLHHPHVERMWTGGLTCRRQSGTYPAQEELL